MNKLLQLKKDLKKAQKRQDFLIWEDMSLNSEVELQQLNRYIQKLKLDILNFEVE